MHMLRIKQVASAALLLLSLGSLAGCGSGGGGGSQPSGPVSLSGRITSTDASVVDSQNNTHFVQAYTFTANTTGVATVTLSSTQFVPTEFVLLGSPTDPNAPLAPGYQNVTNANSSTVTGTFNVTPGNTYTLGITTLDASATGSYNLLFSPGLTNVKQVSATTLNNGFQAQGTREFHR